MNGRHTISNRTSPNHALQRTAPRVTVAAILACARLVRSWRCPTSIASFCAPPSQLPRHAPPSLSLGSLGVATHLVCNHASFQVCRESMSVSETHGLVGRSFTFPPSTAVWPSEGSTVFARPSFLVSVASSVSTSRRFQSSLTFMRSADSPFWPVVAWTFIPTTATPNHALQRTAPGRHACCSPQSPPRSSHAVPPRSLSLGSLGVSTSLP